jgi:hypothetical protein
MKGSEVASFALLRSNIFKRNQTRPSFIWTPTSKIRRTTEIFADQTNFQNATIRVAVVPLTIFINGEKVDTDPEHVWTNFWGLEVIEHGIYVDIINN